MQGGPVAYAERFQVGDRLIRSGPDPYRPRRRMVEELAGRGIADRAVLEAMERVPRHLFVDEALACHAYELTSLPLGLGQTISNPYTVARMTELLRTEPGMRVLEVGTGSGYQAAVLAALGCTVFTTERLPELYRRTRALLESMGLRKIHTFLRDGTQGYAPAAPYDRILVTAGGPVVPPPLTAQLDEGGIMLIPVGASGAQRLKCLVRRGGSCSEQDCGPASFVDLVGDHGR